MKLTVAEIALERLVPAEWHPNRMSQALAAKLLRSLEEFGPVESLVATVNHTRPGEVMYEPFAGSGTCLLAAERTGRRCFAIELAACWCDLIRDRYQAFVDRRGGA